MGGIGQMKILKHRENERIRVLMRQERTMKILCNHLTDPRITMRPNAGSDITWVWRAFDFAEGELEEKTFCIKFKTPELAQEFKEIFDKAQKDMDALMKGLDKPSDKETDEATEAIESLNVKDEETS